MTVLSLSPSSVGGSYTTAALLALSAARSATLSIANCTDCLTPYGVGGLVLWNGSKWVTTTGIEVTTDALTFFRSAAKVGLDVSNDNSVMLPRRGFSMGALSFTTQNSGSFNVIGLPNTPGSETIQLVLAAASSGVRPTGSSAPQFHTGTATHVYLQKQVVLSNLSASGTHDYNVRFGFESATAYTLATGFLGFVYDRANNLAGLNPSNLDKWICVARNASVNSTIVTSVTPSVNQAAKDKLEMLLIPGVSCTFYINDVNVGSLTSNLPSGALSGVDAANTVTFVSGSRSVWLANEMWALRH